MPHLEDPTEALPPFTDDPLDRLVHTLAAYAPTIEKSPGDWVIRATSSRGRVTGLTWADLVALKDRLGR